MIRKKHLSPELREKYDYWERKFLDKHRKKHMALFLIWLVIWLAGAAAVLFLEPNIIISLCFMFWAVGGLVCTLIYNHHCMMYIEANVYDKPEASEAAPEGPESADDSRSE